MDMLNLKYHVFQIGDRLEFVEMPATHAYQLSALNRRLHKELDKLTVEKKPELPYIIAECENLDLIDQSYRVENGLDYINRLEHAFASLDEKAYPLISLLTEIRALQAQLEQWYEEEAEI
jgi:hypothetical protein